MTGHNDEHDRQLEELLGTADDAALGMITDGLDIEAGIETVLGEQRFCLTKLTTFDQALDQAPEPDTLTCGQAADDLQPVAVPKRTFTRTGVDGISDIIACACLWLNSPDGSCHGPGTQVHLDHIKGALQQLLTGLGGGMLTKLDALLLVDRAEAGLADLPPRDSHEFTDMLGQIRRRVALLFHDGSVGRKAGP